MHAYMRPSKQEHIYTQTRAPYAGLVLSITNTCGTLVGIAGNLLTGILAGSSSGYTGAFYTKASTSLCCGWCTGAWGPSGLT